MGGCIPRLDLECLSVDSREPVKGFNERAM